MTENVLGRCGAKEGCYEIRPVLARWRTALGGWRRLRFEERVTGGNVSLEFVESTVELAEGLARDLPYLLDRRRVVRVYETVPAERTADNPLGIYTLTSDRIRHLPEEEVERKERDAEDERSARYRVIYEVLGLRVVARTAPWRPAGDSGRPCCV
ncbi:MAG TPA: hypothetical protein VK902_17515 [Rubrobacter sp.]|nr:hypothetical protein [Rubrobacter sp.]